MLSQNMHVYMEQGDGVLPLTSRPNIYAMENVVSAGHWLTSIAGARILITGGNAYDAAVAAIFAAAVVEPTSSFSLGSECVYAIHNAQTGETLSLCGQGGAPQLATIEFFKQRGLDVIPTGPGPDAPLAFAVPGMVGSALSLLAKYGSMSVSEVLAPAISYACNGVANYEYMLSRLGQNSLDQFALFGDGGSKIFFDDGDIPSPGSVLRQPMLGNTLKELEAASNVEGGDRVAGILAARHMFYSGTIAEKIGALSESVGGLLRKQDLAEFEESYEKPAAVTYNGFTICGPSFWSQAPVLLQALNILRAFDLRAMEFNSAEYVHVVVEALKLAFADREAYYGDPRFTPVPIDRLLDEDYGLERAREIDLARASRDFPHAGSWDGSHPGTRYPWGSEAEEESGPETGTTHISVVDRQGNFVAATPSGGAFNKSVFFSELGFTLSTRSEMLNLIPDHPNCLQPGKRPRTTLVSYLVMQDGKPIMTIGCPGGDAQAQANLQLFLNVAVWGMSPQEAVEAPRFATMAFPNSFYPHSYSCGKLSLEGAFPESVQQTLRDRGHDVSLAATCGFGAIVTRRDPDTGVLVSSSDPRRSSHTIGW